jgi:hypothetical protein
VDSTLHAVGGPIVTVDDYEVIAGAKLHAEVYAASTEGLLRPA